MTPTAPARKAAEVSPVSDGVRELRRHFNESQQSFAYRLGMAVRTVARWESTGKVDQGCLRHLVGIANDAGCDSAASKLTCGISNESEWDLIEALRRLIGELPIRRDWLDPVTEAIAKNALRKRGIEL